MTNKQRLSRERNFTIFKLRGLFGAFKSIGYNHKECFSLCEDGAILIDEILVTLGAEGENARRSRTRREILEEQEKIDAKPNTPLRTRPEINR